MKSAQGRPTGRTNCALIVVHLGIINPSNWEPLLAFRNRLIAGEVATEPSTANETPTARGIRNMACRPISAAKK